MLSRLPVPVGHEHCRRSASKWSLYAIAYSYWPLMAKTVVVCCIPDASQVGERRIRDARSVAASHLNATEVCRYGVRDALLAAAAHVAHAGAGVV